MSRYEINEDLYADDADESEAGSPPSRLVRPIMYALIAAFFIVPIVALLKPHFSQPAQPPALTPANGIQVQTTNFEAVQKPNCTGDFCVGSL